MFYQPLSIFLLMKNIEKSIILEFILKRKHSVALDAWNACYNSKVLIYALKWKRI